MSAVCSAPDCDREAKTRGFCHKHYMRLFRHGSVEDSRPINYGSRIKHDMYISWKAAKAEGRLCERWKNDFWAFAEEAGPRPDMNHLLRRKDESKPFEPGNTYWHQKVCIKKDGETDKEYFARAQRIRRRLAPEENRKQRLRRFYGLTPEQYQEMHDARDGKCDICGKPESGRTFNGVFVKHLAVDHEHSTGKVRGLLCIRCNIAIGAFDDSIESLKAAISYLERHSEGSSAVEQDKAFKWPEWQAANGKPRVFIDTPDGRMEVKEAAKKFGLPKETIMWRIRNGWPESDLLKPSSR